MKFKTKDLVFIAVYVALAIALDYFKEMLPFLNMPQGGSINIALIPIVVASFHLGVAKAVMVGAIWWLLSSILGLNNDIVSPIQYILDYIVPSFIIGAASMFDRHHKVWEQALGIVVVMSIRTISILVSGAYFWAYEVAAGSMAAWTGSIAYNLPYCIATTIMLVIVVPILLPSIYRISDK